MSKKLQTKLLTLNIGPQHPSVHGVLYLKAEVDGEMIVKADPVIGYSHRSVEKIFEERYYNQCIAISDRTCYIDTYFNEMTIVLAIEKLMQIKVPERAEFLRVIMMELNRIAAHGFYWGNLATDLGALATPILWLWREREFMYDLGEEISGYRMHPHFMRVGGVANDVPDDKWLDRVIAFCDEMEKRVEVYERLVSANEIFLLRTKNVGKMTKEWCINWGVTGPILRGSGFKWDLRRNDPYSIYDRFDFDIPVGANADIWDGYKVRMEEIRQSIKIVRQAVSKIPDGPVATKLPMKYKVPKGEAYARVEAARGEQGCYLVSDGGNKPYRLKLRMPSFIHISCCQDLLKDELIADVIALLGHIDPVIPEVDR